VAGECVCQAVLIKKYTTTGNLENLKSVLAAILELNQECQWPAQSLVLVGLGM